MSADIRQTHDSRFVAVKSELLLTAFAAGTVDIIGYSQLGGVFPSAMTGNFALLAFHLAEGNWQSSVGSVVALMGFVVGCVAGFSMSRRRPQENALTVLLSTEAILLLLFAGFALTLLPEARAASTGPLIALLAVAMGLQAVVGQIINLTTIVFTTTLTKLVGTMVGSRSQVEPAARKDVAMQAGVVLTYVCGALLAGVLTVHKAGGAALLPLLAVTFALLANHRARRHPAR
jgi:uncharacterized membrane protein YoaK (UPF0700 family)